MGANMERRIVLLIMGIEALVCAVAAIAGGKAPNYHFIEGGVITWLNAFQIMLLSLAAVAVYRERRALNDIPGGFFWILVAIGAVYLALDELMEFHEHLGRVFKDNHAPRPPLVNGWGDVVLASYAIPVVAVCWSFQREMLADREVLGWLIVGGLILVVSQLLDTFGVHEGKDRMWWSVSEESTKLIGFGTMLGAMLMKWLRVRAARRVEPAAIPA
jgi:hypothetical protein